MTQAHEEVVRDIFRDWADGDFRSRAHFDEYAMLVVRPDFPESGVFVGLGEIAAYLRRFLEQWDRIAFDAEQLDVVGDTVLARAVQHGTGAASGVEGEGPLFILFTFRGPTIIRMETVLRETDAREILGLSR